MTSAELETWLQAQAIYAPDQIKSAPMAELWDKLETEEMARGLMARVFRIKDQPWVMKEGRWDMDFELFKDFRIALPAQLTETVWRQFSQTFLPTREEVSRQYALYLQFAEYFGFFGNDEEDRLYHHPDRARLVARQRDVRTSLVESLHDLEEDYGFSLPAKIKQELHDHAVLEHNFLPKEYLLMGESKSKENSGRETCFIFQEYLPGTHFHDSDPRNLKGDARLQCLLFVLLLLRLHRERHLLPDTRPRYLVLQMHDWLTKTDNLIYGDRGLMFIDTRWFWETDTNFVKRGLWVPEMVIGQAKQLIRVLCEEQ